MGIRTIHRSRILASALLLVMSLAVMAKAIVPAGFMPNAGMTAMVICSGMGEKVVMVPSSEDSDHQDKSEACAYHLAATQKMVPVVLAALPVASNPQIPHIEILHEQFIAEPFATASSQRGPPLLV